MGAKLGAPSCRVQKYQRVVGAGRTWKLLVKNTTFQLDQKNKGKRSVRHGGSVIPVYFMLDDANEGFKISHHKNVNRR